MGEKEKLVKKAYASVFINLFFINPKRYEKLYETAMDLYYQLGEFIEETNMGNEMLSAIMLAKTLGEEHYVKVAKLYKVDIERLSQIIKVLDE